MSRASPTLSSSRLLPFMLFLTAPCILLPFLTAPSIPALPHCSFHTCSSSLLLPYLLFLTAPYIAALPHCSFHSCSSSLLLAFCCSSPCTAPSFLLLFRYLNTCCSSSLLSLFCCSSLVILFLFPFLIAPSTAAFVSHCSLHSCCSFFNCSLPAALSHFSIHVSLPHCSLRSCCSFSCSLNS